jgi:hypothetical protein
MEMRQQIPVKGFGPYSYLHDPTIRDIGDGSDDIHILSLFGEQSDAFAPAYYHDGFLDTMDIDGDIRDLAQLKISCNAFGLGPKIPFQLDDDQAKEEFLALIPPLAKRFSTAQGF